MLSQLSYSPRLRMVGLSGFEPLTSRLSAVRSSQLSYRPVVHFQSRPAASSSAALFGLEGRSSPKEQRQARLVAGPGEWLSENWVDGFDLGENELGLDPLERR